MCVAKARSLHHLGHHAWAVNRSWQPSLSGFEQHAADDQPGEPWHCDEHTDLAQVGQVEGIEKRQPRKTSELCDDTKCEKLGTDQRADEIEERPTPPCA